MLIASTPGIFRKHRTKASFSHLQLLESEGSLARKLRFDDAICMLGFAGSNVFVGENGGSAGEQGRLVRARSQALSRISRIASALELMVPGDFLHSLMMLCYCVLHVLKHFVQ